MFVFVRQFLRLDQARLQQPGDKGAGAGKRVNDMHALAAQGLAELFLQQVVDAMQDEVHHLHRGVDDAQPFGHFREGVAKELVVQLDNDLLLALRAVDALGTQLHAVVEVLQRGGFFFQALLMQHIQHRLHRLGHGVVAGEAVIGKQRIEHRLCDQVLGQHLDDFSVADLVVQVIAQLGGESIERLAGFDLTFVFQQRADAVDMGIGDLGDIVSPVLPVVAVAAFVHHLGVQRTLDLADFEGHLKLIRCRAVDLGLLTDGVLALGLVRRADFQRAGLALHGIGDGDDFHLAAVRADQIQLVDHRIEAVIVGAQRLQHLPDHGIGLVVVEGLVRLHAGRDHHRQHHVATLLARCIAHHPAHRLHHVHLRITRGQKQHRIQRRHVHALGQAAHVGEDATGVIRCGSLEPVQLGFLLAGVHAAVHVLGLAGKPGRLFNVLSVLVGLHDLLEHAGDFLGADLRRLAALAGFDHLAERDRPLHRLGCVAAILRNAEFGQGLPAADDLGRVIHAQAVVLIGEQRLQAAVDVGFLHRQHDDLVVHQQAALYRLGEGDDEQLLAVPVLVVHRVQGGVVAFGDCLGAIAVDAWRGSHVQTLGSTQVIAVMDAYKGAFIIALEGSTGGAMGLVADNQVEFGKALLLRLMDHVDGVVGAEHHRHMVGVMAGSHAQRQPPGIGGGRITQLMGEGLHGIVLLAALLLADVTVRTDGETVQRDSAFLGPFGQGLRQQRQTRDEEQHMLALASHRFSDLETGEGFASAAGHNQLATVGIGQTGNNRLQCGLLVRTK